MSDEIKPADIIQAAWDSVANPLSVEFETGSKWSRYAKQDEQPDAYYGGSYRATILFVKGDRKVCVREHSAPTLAGLMLKIKGEA